MKNIILMTALVLSFCLKIDACEKCEEYHQRMEKVISRIKALDECVDEVCCKNKKKFPKIHEFINGANVGTHMGYDRCLETIFQFFPELEKSEVIKN